MPSWLPPRARLENLCQQTPPLANVTLNECTRMQDTAQKVACACYVSPCATGNRNHRASLQLSRVFVWLCSRRRDSLENTSTVRINFSVLQANLSCQFSMCFSWVLKSEVALLWPKHIPDVLKTSSVLPKCALLHTCMFTVLYVVGM